MRTPPGFSGGVRPHPGKILRKQAEPWDFYARAGNGAGCMRKKAPSASAGSYIVRHCDTEGFSFRDLADGTIRTVVHSLSAGCFLSAGFGGWEPAGKNGRTAVHEAPGGGHLPADFGGLNLRAETAGQPPMKPPVTAIFLRTSAA